MTREKDMKIVAFRPQRLGRLSLLLLIVSAAHAETALELETTRIKVNEELPQILYIVPWKEFEPGSGKRFKLQLHDFFSDLYEPQLPANHPSTEMRAQQAEDQPSS